ncbi:substrate-binding domain-containing protein [Bacillus sp. 3255]|uniref:substrate-binding domain-containing protein n=1 Tax=Bacillus sp. 3255 TaxID=2817904 RepID=UPI0028563AE5|nr:substrate-binding domain-containing protein [Bacillus sp. 3255]MDR6883308.1 ribose transport system substrate-binding protein [Bacillus sp. 3255]
MSRKYGTFGLIGLAFIFSYCIIQFLSSTWQIHRLVKEMAAGDTGREAGKRVILIAQERDNPFWRTVEQGARETAAQLGMQVDYMGPIRINPAEQANLLEKSIAAKPDAVLLQGIKEPAYEELINKAAEAGIPVITVDADAPGSRRLAYIGTDNREAGQRMGELVSQEAVGKGRIGVMIGSERADNQLQRLEGFRSLLADRRGFEIVDVRSSNISRLQAARQTEAMLQANPGIQTMVGFSSLDASGIVEGLKAANRNDIRVFGFDDLEETRKGIDQGTIKAVVVQHPREIGAKSVYWLNEFYQGHAIPAQSFTATDIMKGNP